MRENISLCTPQSAGVNIARLAVRHSCATEGVGVHLLGCNTPAILRLNIAAALTPFTEQEARLVDTIVG